MTALSLVRKVFKTSRLAKFRSEKELVNQTGHDSDDWPLVILKELIDNALDACEEAGAAPVIHVAVSDAEIAVIKEMPAGTIAVPDDLNARVREYLDKNPESPWEAAVRYVVCEP